MYMLKINVQLYIYIYIYIYVYNYIYYCVVAFYLSIYFGMHRTSYERVRACVRAYNSWNNSSKHGEIIISPGREFQSRMVAGKNEC